MPAAPARRQQPPIQYRDRQDRIWSVLEVAVLKVVSPAVDGPNLCLVIRFEHEGEERLARWIGGDDWQQRAALDHKPPEAPIAMRLQWIREVAEMGPDALALFEQQTFQQWDRASLVAVRRAIDARRRELGTQ